ncbi:MAG: glycoside hydrolase N-terminal domain-containing protein [Nibricoccus sp.]
MNPRSWFLPLLLLSFVSILRADRFSPDKAGSVLWYDQPASRWEEALPIGNGRIAAMVFGHPRNERIQLNEGTLWAGGPYEPVNPEAKAALPEVRRLIDDGKYKEAAWLISSKVMAKPLNQMPYQTVGDLHLAFTDQAFENYRRDLDLDTATTTVSYTSNGVRYKRETFANAPENVIVVRLTADKAGMISFVATAKTPMAAAVSTDNADTLIMTGVGGDSGGIKGAIRYQARFKILAEGGTVTTTPDAITVTGANTATLLIVAATNYKRFDDVGGDPETITRNILAAALKKSFGDLRQAHLKDYQALFRRVSIDLGRTDAASLPTNVRIERFAGGNDPQLAALYYQFARYLLISCSRPGGQPANLQGLWNESLRPPWQSKYTININTEMNYWPAESGNLAECIDPLIAMVEDLTITGGRMARQMYGARGWVVHHNTDIWRASAPIDGPDWGMWPTGGAWLCLHLWDRYEFSGDKAVLQRIYPALKSACEFFLDTLHEVPAKSWLVTSPSISPELNHPFGTSVCAGPAMDQQILRDLFAHTIEASGLLGVDEEFREQLQAARARLAPNQIGREGQLQEWLEDWDSQIKDIHHRHVSHLYGLFPGRDISRLETPELANAARKSLDTRGDKATGWATAWRICLWTHLGDGERAYEILKLLITPGLTYPNLFDAHPPFQIDGNFGGAAGIVEMLMQSRPGGIECLPALPKALPDGSVKGLRARGGFQVDLAWKDSQLMELAVTSLNGGTTRLRYGSVTREVNLGKGETYRWDGRAAQPSVPVPPADGVPVPTGLPPQARAAFGRPIVLTPDDVPAFPEPTANISERRAEVPHGKLETVEYESKTVGTRRKMRVYTPPGYSDDQTYPVVYLLHGIGGDETEWERFCSPDILLDNLIAEGKATPMIVVMPNGRARKNDRAEGDIFAAAPAFAVFERDLLDDVIPAIDSRYRTRANRDSRALAGLSMGGGQALNFGLTHLDTFAWIGGFSSAPNTRPPQEIVPEPDRAKSSLKLLWLSCGNKDGLINFSQRLHVYLKEAGVPHVWTVSDRGHEATEWRNNAYYFFQHLFRP